MNKQSVLMHEFVEFLPDVLEQGKLYVSMPYATVAHKCCCGCGKTVMTPLSPTDWKMTFDGKTVSLYPSIGNWNFACRSHYWIKNSRVEWAEQWTQERIVAARQADQSAKQQFFETPKKTPKTGLPSTSKKQGLFDRLKKWW